MSTAAMAAAPSEAAAGWRASLVLECEHRRDRTVLSQRRQRGPLAVQRPFYPEGSPCHLYLLHPPGGVVGGDVLSIEINIAADAHALVTTPGATKFYRSARAPAIQKQTLDVADGACLEWMPQENILFPGANVRFTTEVRLRGDARFLGWEVHCLGRPVIGEAFRTGRARFRFALYRDGRPLFCDRLEVAGDRDLQRPAGLRGRPVFGTLIVTGTDQDAVQHARDAVAAIPEDEVAVTRLDDVLAVRYLGDSTEAARQSFVAVWRALRPHLAGRAACAPRIWAT
jgi:urease accessory protein